LARLMSRRPPWRGVVRCLPPFRTGIVTPQSRPGKRPRHTGHYWETETEAVSARNRKFESISLQQTVRLSRELACRGRKPGRFPRVCGPWQAAQSPETGIARRHGAERRQCLCWAKFQYRRRSGRRLVATSGRRAKQMLAQLVNRSRVTSVAHARPAGDASGPAACLRSDRVAGGRRGSPG